MLGDMLDYIQFLGIVVVVDFLLLWFVVKRLQFKVGFLLALMVVVIVRALDDMNFHAAESALIDPVDVLAAAGIGALYSIWKSRKLVTPSTPQEKKT